MQRYQQDLPRIRQLGQRAASLDELFYHRISRTVRKDGTVAYQGQRFEVPYELSGQAVQLVVDPHTEQALWVPRRFTVPAGAAGAGNGLPASVD